MGHLDNLDAALKRTAGSARAAGAAMSDYAKYLDLASTKAALALDKIAPLGGVLGRVATEAQNATGNLNGMASAAGQCNDALGQGIGIQGKATVMLLQVQQATEAQTVALKEQLKAIDALNAAQEHTLDTATGWKDYLVTLTENYKSGTSSLLVYIQSLNDFGMQIRTLFAGATGDAKAAIDDMIAMIDRLVATAGSVKTNTDTSYTGVLNKTFNKP
jgi:hypothetical protein